MLASERHSARRGVLDTMLVQHLIHGPHGTDSMNMCRLAPCSMLAARKPLGTCRLNVANLIRCVSNDTNKSTSPKIAVCSFVHGVRVTVNE
ncbi:hypothetical protein RBSWK_04011 [Rhodopirellula baltica SWK14]|uniref:Uncharacterized protein n=1 Tax=Rhodopirellula baltica SWK14 TaxID=993516 RepID=L7CDI3_RHOBT|nr:hypothetical protein RBSWK_04011 [Rhodopirellula baltica SWK14]